MSSVASAPLAVAKQQIDPTLKQFVRETTKKFLSKKNAGMSDKIADAILESSKKYDFDPVFLMAVIQNESSFNPEQKGGVGELGLMQIKPKAAAWIAKKYKLEYKNAKSLLDPAKNIKIGVAMMDKLRKQFKKTSGHMYLAAYNMGEGNARKFVQRNAFPRTYARAVMMRYLAMFLAYSTPSPANKKASLALQNVAKLSPARASNRSAKKSAKKPKLAEQVSTQASSTI